MAATEEKVAIVEEADTFSKLLLSPEKTTYTKEEIEEYNRNIEKYIEAEVSKRVIEFEAKLAEKKRNLTED